MTFCDLIDLNSLWQIQYQVVSFFVRFCPDLCLFKSILSLFYPIRDLIYPWKRINQVLTLVWDSIESCIHFFFTFDVFVSIRESRFVFFYSGTDYKLR